MVNQAGIGDVHAAIHSAAPLDTWIVVKIDSDRPYGIETAGNKVVLNIFPKPGQAAGICREGPGHNFMAARNDHNSEITGAGRRELPGTIG